MRQAYDVGMRTVRLIAVAFPGLSSKLDEKPGKEEIKKSPGKRISLDSYGSHYLSTMCLFAGGQVQGT